MNEPIVVASLITLIGGLGTTIVGGMVYMWRRDPAGQRNVADSVVELARVTERLNSAHSDYLYRMQEQDQRNRDEHKSMLKALEQLTDFVAPRRQGGPK